MHFLLCPFFGSYPLWDFAAEVRTTKLLAVQSLTASRSCGARVSAQSWFLQIQAPHHTVKTPWLRSRGQLTVPFSWMSSVLWGSESWWLGVEAEVWYLSRLLVGMVARGVRLSIQWSSFVGCSFKLAY